MGSSRGIALGNTISLTLCLWLLAATTAWGQAWNWTQAGYGGGGRFTAIAVDPADAGQMVVGSDVAGYFLSTDGGQTFSPRGQELGGLAVSALAYHPDRPGILAVQASDGLYLSRDHGRTLTLLSPRLGYPARFFGGRLLIFQGDKLLVATSTRGVCAVAWDSPTPAETNLPGIIGVKVNSLAMLGEEIFAATEQGAFRFKDGRFSPANEGLGSRMHLQDMASTAAGGLYAVERDDGLYRWDAAQNRWSRPGTAMPRPREGTLSFKTVALDPARPGRIFVGTHPETWPKILFVSEDGGASWKQSQPFILDPDAPANWAKGLDAVEALIFASDGQTAWLADWWNLWRSTPDGGWRQVHRGLQNVVVNDLIRDPAKAETLLMATADNGLMVSDDSGGHWAPSMQGVPDGHVKAIRVCKGNPDKRYLLSEPWVEPKKGAGVTYVVCKSTDGGRNWKQLPITVPAKSLPGAYADGKATLLVIDPRNEDVVYVGSNGHGLFKVNTVLLDQGKPAEAVQEISRTLPVPCFQGPNSLLVDTDDPLRLTASLVGSGLWGSSDGGAKWAMLNPRWTFSFGLAVDPSRPERLFVALAEKKVGISQDGGRTWRETALPGNRPPGIAVDVVAVDPGNPDIVYAGTMGYDFKAADGLFVSTDGGASFKPVPSDLPRVNITALSPGPGGLLVGFNGLGLYRVEPGK